MTSRSEDLTAAALAYAEAGWPVFPLKTRNKVPATRHGVLDASTNLDLVEAWWAMNPEANIGLRCGIVFDVVDIDGDPAKAVFREVLPGYKHAGPKATTGRGWHLYFAAAGLRNSADPERKLDYRGINGYVVAPPSVHPNGHRYRWLHWPDPMDLPTIPTELKEAIGARRPNLIDPTTLSRPRADVPWPLEQLIDEWKGPQRWRRKGALLVTECPMGTHSDSSPSFTVFPDQHYYCFGCGAWGTAYWIATRELRKEVIR